MHILVLSQLTSSPPTARLWEKRDSPGTPLLQQLLQLLSHAHSSLVSVNFLTLSPPTARLWEKRDSPGTPLLQQLLQLLSHAHSGLVSVNFVSPNNSPLGET
ncbi:hypothetical protein RRG08_059933 [Elysia crispata]|uniref:Uncharacterized protein n=1 Tax=Elysia crispata TaxID=231223 RepID=A0AAE1CTX7_9GAST|nr:hypothetical protein RRG08_059933 [Elysia crispata]